jgi:hypothetical protein
MDNDNIWDFQSKRSVQRFSLRKRFLTLKAVNPTSCLVVSELNRKRDTKGL